MNELIEANEKARYNETLVRVNDCVVRLGVIHGLDPWCQIRTRKNSSLWSTARLRWTSKAGGQSSSNTDTASPCLADYSMGRARTGGRSSSWSTRRGSSRARIRSPIGLMTKVDGVGRRRPVGRSACCHEDPRHRPFGRSRRSPAGKGAPQLSCQPAPVGGNVIDKVRYQRTSTEPPAGRPLGNLHPAARSRP